MTVQTLVVPTSTPAIGLGTGTVRRIIWRYRWGTIVGHSACPEVGRFIAEIDKAKGSLFVLSELHDALQLGHLQIQVAGRAEHGYEVLVADHGQAVHWRVLDTLGWDAKIGRQPLLQQLGRLDDLDVDVVARLDRLPRHLADDHLEAITRAAVDDHAVAGHPERLRADQPGRLRLALDHADLQPVRQHRLYLYRFDQRQLLHPPLYAASVQRQLVGTEVARRAFDGAGQRLGAAGRHQILDRLLHCWRRAADRHLSHSKRVGLKGPPQPGQSGGQQQRQHKGAEDMPRTRSPRLLDRGLAVPQRPRPVHRHDRHRWAHPSPAHHNPGSSASVIPISHQLHLHLERLFHAGLRQRDEGAHVMRAGAAQVDDEVGVLLGYLRIADAVALQTGLLDEIPGSRAGRVLEHRARVGQCEWLGVAPLSAELARLRGILSTEKTDPWGENDRRGALAAAVPVAQLAGVHRQRLDRAVPRQEPNPAQAVGHAPAVGACVAHHRPPHAAGNAGGVHQVVVAAFDGFVTDARQHGPRLRLDV